MLAYENYRHFNMSVYIIIHSDIVYNICSHLDDKSCLSFLLTCKESPLEQTSIKSIKYGDEKFKKYARIYEKRVTGYMISKAYRKRSRFVKRLMRMRRYLYSYDDFEEYNNYESYESYDLTLYHNLYTTEMSSDIAMFQNIEGIDKELLYPRPILHGTILDSDQTQARALHIKALDDELDEYMALR
jgi:hypothetical protein